VQFFNRDEVATAFKDEEAMAYVYKIHCLVDDKLECQRLDRLFEAVKVSKDLQDQLRSASSILSGRPTLQVVMKRWELCEGKPFSKSSVWRVLFAFVMLIDTDEEAEKRREAIKSWVKNLSIVLMDTVEYKDLGIKLSVLSENLPSYPYSSRHGFAAIALAREGMLKVPLDFEDMKSVKVSENAWLKPLWSAYKHNMPAGACGRFTCS
jgi:hypothetical protein